MGDPPRIGPNVATEFGHCFEELAPIRTDGVAIQVDLQILHGLQRPEDVAMPEQPLQSLEFRGDVVGKRGVVPRMEAFGYLVHDG